LNKATVVPPTLYGGVGLPKIVNYLYCHQVGEQLPELMYIKSSAAKLIVSFLALDNGQFTKGCYKTDIVLIQPILLIAYF